MSFDPIWSAATSGGFQEVWYLKLNDPAAQRALWLRFTLLTSRNGFRRVAETWAILFERNESREIAKTALKQTHDLREFRSERRGMITIGGCELEASLGTKGVIQSKGRTLKWDFAIRKGAIAPETGFNHVPETLTRSGVVKNTALTVAEDLAFSGTTELDGRKIEWNAAPGMLGHLAGPKNGHSWVWGHCNAFVDEAGRAVPALFEGLTARARLAGGVPTPRLSAFYFRYGGQDYRFCSLWDAVRARSQNTLTEWRFQADRGEISFRGHARAEHRDFAGVTYEDTDGSFLYCANSKLSEMTLLVYRRGKLEATLHAPGTAAFEVVTRQQNPYVPLLI